MLNDNLLNRPFHVERHHVVCGYVDALFLVGLFVFFHDY